MNYEFESNEEFSEKLDSEDILSEFRNYVDTQIKQGISIKSLTRHLRERGIEGKKGKLNYKV